MAKGKGWITVALAIAATLLTCSVVPFGVAWYISSLAKEARVQPQPTPAPTPVRNPSNHIIRMGSTEERLRAFPKIVQGANLPCPKADFLSERGTDLQGTAYWHVACSNGRQYQVSIPAVDVRAARPTVVDCRLLERAGGSCSKSIK